MFPTPSSSYTENNIRPNNATERALSTLEILELMFPQLPTRSVLAIRGICRSWYIFVATSPALQKWTFETMYAPESITAASFAFDKASRSIRKPTIKIPTVTARPRLVEDEEEIYTQSGETVYWSKGDVHRLFTPDTCFSSRRLRPLAEVCSSILTVT